MGGGGAAGGGAGGSGGAGGAGGGGGGGGAGGGPEDLQGALELAQVCGPGQAQGIGDVLKGCGGDWDWDKERGAGAVDRRCVAWTPACRLRPWHC